jgi:hypothetical protein
MGEDMSDLEERLDKLQERAHVHDICFRNAGVGILFYEGPDYYGDDKPERPSDWRKHFLHVYKYYPTLREAIEAEHKRLDGVLEPK